MDPFLYINGHTSVKILKRFKMEEVANTVAIPADPNHQMSTSVHINGEKEVENIPYREAVGSLMYLSIGTRPDITFAVNSVSQFLERPMKIHWNAVKRILKYLKETADHGLYYSAAQTDHLKAFMKGPHPLSILHSHQKNPTSWTLGTI